MGLFQDPELWQGLKIAKEVFIDKLLKAGSSISLVTIRKNMAKNKAILLVLPLFFLPILAYAGVFSFIVGIFSSPVLAEEEVATLNLQNMPVLQAVSSPLSATTTESDPIIVDGNSLSKEIIVYSDDKNSESDLISIYVVHKGDTLPEIAKMFDVTVNTIRWANDIKGNTVTVGQTLVILPVSGIKHTVKSGDNLQSIAKYYKGDVDEIMQYNNISLQDKLAIGEVIIIPDGEAGVVVNSTKPSLSSNSNTPVYSGYYMRPIVGGVRTQGIHGHNGIDFAAPYGSNILASADGQVIIARTGWNGGYGTYIVIKHGNGTQTLYAHLSGLNVSSGQSVKQGQVIGFMGNSGSVRGRTGIHLHFEVRGARNPF
ncbi:MAG: peptidoglycan DD-metalloendopeptidase family protein [Minisyncoccia bacterium]